MKRRGVTYSSLKTGVKKKGAREKEDGEEGCVANRKAQLKAQEDGHSTHSLLTTAGVVAHADLVLSYQSFGRRPKTPP